ncbi:MAG: Maf family protein [Planctomycetota bacterium]
MTESFILASSSPRRKKLLHEAGFRFKVVFPIGDEPILPIPPGQLAQQLSLQKAESIAFQYPNFWILGADTIVALGQKIFGKPHDLDEAEQFLTQLSGKLHQVWTGYTLLQREKKFSCIERTDVSFYPVSQEQIRHYVNTHRPLDKAGAYGIQELDSHWIASIQGSYTNVVGLPMEAVTQTLLQAGIEPV